MFFFSVSGVFCRWRSAGGFFGGTLTLRSLIFACSTPDMTTLTMESLKKDLPVSPALTGSERKMSPRDIIKAPRAKSRDVESEPKDPACPGLPQTIVVIVQGPVTM